MQAVRNLLAMKVASDMLDYFRDKTHARPQLVRILGASALVASVGLIVFAWKRRISARGGSGGCQTLPKCFALVTPTVTFDSACYAHGGGKAASAEMLQHTFWRELLCRLSPTAAARLSDKGAAAVPPQVAAAVLENNPVLAAFYTSLGLQRISVEWDIYAKRTTFDEAGAHRDPLSLLSDTVVQHGSLGQVVLERGLGWEAHDSVRAMSGEMSVPRWLAAYFTALREASLQPIEAGLPGTLAPISSNASAGDSITSAYTATPLLSVFLDIKSTRLSAAGVAALVRCLNEAGVHVWGAGSFILPQLAAVSAVPQNVVCPVRDTSSPSSEAASAAGASDSTAAPGLRGHASTTAMCDDALAWLRRRFPAEDIRLTPAPAGSLRPEADAAAAPSTAEAQAQADASGSLPKRITCPPPLPLYLFSTAAQMQRMLMAHPLPHPPSLSGHHDDHDDVWSVPVGASVLFNGGSLLRPSCPPSFAAAFYDETPVGHPDHVPVQAALTACGVDADAAAAVAAHVEAAAAAGGSSASAGCAEGALPLVNGAAAVPVQATSSPVGTETESLSLPWAALLARRSALVQAVHTDASLRRALLPALYDCDAMDLLRAEAAPPSHGGRSLRFGLYADEPQLEPLAAALLAVLAEAEQDLVPLGFNYGGFHGSMAVQPRQVSEWRRDSAAAAAQLQSRAASAPEFSLSTKDAVRRLLNGCIIPWWLVAIGAVPVRVKPQREVWRRAAKPAPEAEEPLIGQPVTGRLQVADATSA